jgi:hypothetical protein
MTPVPAVRTPERLSLDFDFTVNRSLVNEAF